MAAQPIPLDDTGLATAPYAKRVWQSYTFLLNAIRRAGQLVVKESDARKQSLFERFLRMHAVAGAGVYKRTATRPGAEKLDRCAYWAESRAAQKAQLCEVTKLVSCSGDGGMSDWKSPSAGLKFCQKGTPELLGVPNLAKLVQ